MTVLSMAHERWGCSHRHYMAQLLIYAELRMEPRAAVQLCPFCLVLKILSDALAIEKGVTPAGFKTLSLVSLEPQEGPGHYLSLSCWLLFVWETFVS